MEDRVAELYYNAKIITAAMIARSIEIAIKRQAIIFFSLFAFLPSV